MWWQVACDKNVVKNIKLNLRWTQGFSLEGHLYFGHSEGAMSGATFSLCRGGVWWHVTVEEMPVSCLCHRTWNIVKWNKSTFGGLNTVRVDRLPHRKWKETKQQPGTAGPGNMLGCCLVSFHFLSAILCPQAVIEYVAHMICMVNLIVLSYNYQFKNSFSKKFLL